MIIIWNFEMNVRLHIFWIPLNEKSFSLSIHVSSFADYFCTESELSWVIIERRKLWPDHLNWEIVEEIFKLCFFKLLKRHCLSFAFLCECFEYLWIVRRGFGRLELALNSCSLVFYILNKCQFSWAKKQMIACFCGRCWRR